MSIRDAILGAQDLSISPVEVPEWGTTVYVRTMTGTERSQYQASLIELSADGRDRRIVLENADVRLAVLTLCEEDGTRVFADLAEGVQVLGRKSARAIARIVEKAQELNALSENDIGELTSGLKSEP